MSRWFRLDDDVINDPKILLLPEAMRWIWVAFLCVASKNNGVLPSIEIVALSLRVKTTKAAEYITRLVSAGLIDKTETGFAPHNWNARQYKSDVSTERVKRFRQQDRNVSETAPETEAETHTEAKPEKKEKEPRAGALVNDGWPNDFREQFWTRYPNKVARPKALLKLEGCRKRGVPWLDIWDGLQRYIREKPPDRSWMNPETFLNGERWNDQPAKVENGQRAGNTRTTGHDAILAAATRAAGKIVGDGAMAGAGGSPEFPEWHGSDGRGAPRHASPEGCPAANHHGRESGPGGVLEGEIIAPDKTAAGLSDRRQFV